MNPRRLERWCIDGLGPPVGDDFGPQFRHFAQLSVISVSGRDADTAARRLGGPWVRLRDGRSRPSSGSSGLIQSPERHLCPYLTSQPDLGRLRVCCCGAAGRVDDNGHSADCRLSWSKWSRPSAVMLPVVPRKLASQPSASSGPFAVTPCAIFSGRLLQTGRT